MHVYYTLNVVYSTCTYFYMHIYIIHNTLYTSMLPVLVGKTFIKDDGRVWCEYYVATSMILSILYMSSVLAIVFHTSQPHNSGITSTTMYLPHEEMSASYIID